MRRTLPLTRSMLDINMMEIEVRYQNRCSLGISLKFEYALRKIQRQEYIDVLMPEIVHKSCKELMCKKSCLETNFSFKYGRFSDWVVFFLDTLYMFLSNDRSLWNHSISTSMLCSCQQFEQPMHTSGKLTSHYEGTTHR